MRPDPLSCVAVPAFTCLRRGEDGVTRGGGQAAVRTSGWCLAISSSRKAAPEGRRRPLFPAGGRDEGDVEHGSKARLAHLKPATQAFDIAGSDGRSGLRQSRCSQGDFAPTGHRTADILDAADQFVRIEGLGFCFHFSWCFLILLTAACSRFFCSGSRSAMLPFV